MDCPSRFEFEHALFNGASYASFSWKSANYESIPYSLTPSIGWKKKCNPDSLLYIPWRTKDKKYVVFKCFTSNHESWDNSYRLIKDEIDAVLSPYLVPFEIHENELLIDAPGCDKKSFTVFVSEYNEDWITLGSFVSRQEPNSFFYKKDAVAKLSVKFSKLAIWLLQQSFAHGSIHPDNIIVSYSGDEIHLVNYEKMFVPAMQDHSFYDATKHNSHIDDLPLIVLSLALRAAALLPELRASLIYNFFKSDLRSLDSSYYFRTICSLIKDPIISNLLDAYNLAKSNIPINDETIHLLEVPDNSPTTCQIISIPEFKYNQMMTEKTQISSDSSDHKSNEELVKWYRKAADLGDVEGAYELGMYYKNRFNYGKAIPLLEKAAEQGYADAKSNWAFCCAYYVDDSIDPDEDENYEIRKKLRDKKRWLELAAQCGNSSAQIELAEMCRLINDYDGHFHWTYMNATQHECEVSQYYLGICYLFGKGVEKDPSAAFKHYQKAASKGYAKAYNALGFCYAKGLGTQIDYYKAAECFRQAIMSSRLNLNEVAFYNLGRCYELGYGVKVNKSFALAYYEKAQECAGWETGVFYSDIERVGGYVDWEKFGDPYRGYDGSGYVYNFLLDEHHKL